MHKKTLLPKLMIALLLASFLTAFSALPVRALDPDISVLNPSTGNGNFIFGTNTAPLGFRFNITVMVNAGTNVVGWQVRIRYNATLLNATRAWVPSTDSQYIFLGIATFTPPPFFETGRLKMGDTTVPPTGVTFTTPKELCTVEFKIMKEPLPGPGNKVSATLYIDDPDTYILNPDLVEIPSVKTNGYYELDWVPSLSINLKVTPPLNPEVSLGQVFVVGVGVVAATNLYAYEFKLFWNKTLLSLIQVGITVPSQWGTNYIIGQNRTDQDLGRYWLAVTALYPAPHFSGNTTLVWLTFKVSYNGNARDVYGQIFPTTLALGDTVLIDDQGADVPHGVLDCTLNVAIHFLADITGPNGTPPDGKVDIRDLAFAGIRYGSVLGDPRYDPRADITGPVPLMVDGKIDMRDLAFIAAHFGESVT